MTIQTVVTSAAIRVIGSAAATVFSSTDQVMIEMRDLVQDVAIDIATSQDWRDLTVLDSFTGDGVTDAFPKPADYDRMVQGSDIDDQNMWLWGYTAVQSINDWMRRIKQVWISPGGWILLGGQFKFYPAPSGIAEYAYVSNLIVRAEDGTPKREFTADTDTFVLPERLLVLGLIWRYRAQKGLDYSEDMATYETALSQAQVRDRGARTVRKSEQFNSRAAVAWPWPLG